MGLILGSGSTKPQYPYDMWYGVQGDFTSKDYKLTRIGNMDLHRTLPIQKKLRRFVENTDGSVKYYLHQNDSRKKDSGATAKLDTTDGNVMLEKPEYFCRFEVEGTRWAMCISEYALPGFVRMSRKTLSPWCATINIANSIAVSGCWLQWGADDELLRDANGFISLLPNAANFRGGSGASDANKDGTFCSQLGMPRTSISKAGARPFCKNGTHLGVARAYMEIAWLQRIEYASLHCQEAYNETLTADGFHQGGLGSGPAVDGGQWNTWGGYRPFVPCGVTAPLGNNTGRISYTIKGWTGGDKVVQCLSYRGLELPYEYLWLLADDLLVHCSPETADDPGHCTAYGCTDPAKFASPSDTATSIPDGYVPITELPTTEGYIWNFGFSYDGFTLPTSVGGASNQGMCDYFWRVAKATANGWYGALLSAVADAGAVAGFGYLLAYYRSSWTKADGAFRLCRF
ncbi:hypothetical protein E4T81_14860 [Barnesiella sp. WM24]|uniref:hypothetical protein n=1 Tax=Barnesiella sp. WM24 TaxID=2558278 RepID=UPI001072581E|nr:hypothetical protein [Barnesiella sp. WM24]TFU91776.1 hypothetical protein E4T81_14860 [Barnesiella sp. WM24]